jgi:hypothetical protein
MATESLQLPKVMNWPGVETLKRSKLRRIPARQPPIYTVDEHRAAASSLAVRVGRLLYVGDWLGRGRSGSATTAVNRGP